MASAASIIKKFMNVLDNTTSSGTAALTQAVKAVSNFTSWSQVITTMVKDCASYSGNGTKFLKNMCGIVLNNSDTGAITGSDAGGSTTKTAASIVPESGSWKYPSSTSFKIQGLTVTVPEKSSLSSAEKYIVGGLYTWWIKSSLNLIKNSYGMTFKESGTTVNNIKVSFYNRADNQVAYVSYGSGQKNHALNMKINSYYLSDINKNNSNGSASALLTYFDRTIAHEMAHAVMSANVDYFSKLPFSFKEGSAELVHGIDDKRKSDILALASDSTALRSAVFGSSGKSYAGGYIALRYFAKQASKKRNPSVSANVSENLWGDSTQVESLTAENNFISQDSLSTILPEKSPASDLNFSPLSNFNPEIIVANSSTLENNA